MLFYKEIDEIGQRYILHIVITVRFSLFLLKQNLFLLFYDELIILLFWLIFC